MFHLQELFRRVNPQHCLGSIWSRRDKKSRSPNVSSVKATVNQFNSVCNCVMTTVLSDTGMSPHDRAKLLCKWIETAQVSIFTRFVVLWQKRQLCHKDMASVVPYKCQWGCLTLGCILLRLWVHSKFMDRRSTSWKHQIWHCQVVHGILTKTGRLRETCTSNGYLQATLIFTLYMHIWINVEIESFINVQFYVGFE